jgi:hypothetical protein
MACRRCQERGKTWEGSDPSCSFPDGVFSSKGWNCATAGELRDLVRQDEEDSLSVYSDDCNAALLPWEASFILLSWYKHRGRTDGAWLVSSGEITPLTLEQAEGFLDAAAPADIDRLER